MYSNFLEIFSRSDPDSVVSVDVDPGNQKWPQTRRKAEKWSNSNILSWKTWIRIQIIMEPQYCMQHICVNIHVRLLLSTKSLKENIFPVEKERKKERTSIPSISGQKSSSGILEQSMGARNRVGIGLPYRPARLHRLAQSIPCNRFLVFLQV